MKKVLLAAAMMGFALTACTTKENNQNMNDMNSTLTLTQEWDKVFPQSDKVDHKKVTFHNRFGIELAADMYIPKNAIGKLAAIAVSGPFGAVKEQVSGLYAQTLAERGYHKRSLNSNEGWAYTSQLSFMNMPLLTYINEIRTPVLMIHGEKAHSRYFSETAFENMTGVKPEGQSKIVGNKELMIIPGASHTDLYDNLQVIPFDKIEQFYRDNLK